MPSQILRFSVTTALLILACGVVPAYAQIARVSVASDGTQLIGGGTPAISGDGRFVFFFANSSNVMPDGGAGLHVHDRQSGETRRIAPGSNPAVSDDGRYVAFLSHASDLVPGDTNGVDDVFLHDRQSGQIKRVSVASDGSQANESSFGPAISGDGRFVAFQSLASNLVPGDTNGMADVFVHDTMTNRTERVSVASDGAQGLPGLPELFPRYTRPALSADGRFVAFTSEAANLVPGDTTICWADVVHPTIPRREVNCPDVFVRDRLTGQTTRVSVASDGTPSERGGDFPAISADGRYVAFLSQARNLGLDDPIPFPGPGGTLGIRDFFAQTHGAAFVHDRLTGQTMPVSRRGFMVGPPSLSGDGRYIAYAWQYGLVATDQQVYVRDRLKDVTTTVSVSAAGEPGNLPSFSPMLSGNGAIVTFASPASNLVPGDTNSADDVFVVNHVDFDGDGIPNDWEELFGLNPFDPGDAAAESNGSGRTNLEVFQAGGHPRALPAATRYLAEGATGGFFSTYLGLANPGVDPVAAVLRFVRPDGTHVAEAFGLPPMSSRRVAMDLLLGGAHTAFATVLEANGLLVLDRTMTWPYGAHAETALTSPALEWYFAEGATHGPFDLFYLLQNPNDTAATVAVTYLRPAPAPPVTRTYTVEPHARFNIWLSAADPELGQFDVAARVGSDKPIIAERAMYLSAPGLPFLAGHSSAGLTAPATSWFLAEGATGPYFDLFVLIANTTDEEAQVEARYLLPDGTVYTKSYRVAPQSRFNIWVDDETIPGIPGKPLADTAVSTVLTSLNGVPILVERAMWWPGTGWYEAHNSAGATETGTKWAVADGEVGGPGGTETYLLIANTSDVPGVAAVTLLFAGETAITRQVMLPANSRTNVPVGQFFPEAAGQTFGAVVESLGAPPAAIVVERAMYRMTEGRPWGAGTNALATKLQ
jgi:Tol biopolymer transport system component